jgi:hypothetical protein
VELVVLYNDLDDCLLYIDGKQYQDMDYRWAECMMWLSDTVTGFNVEFREVNLHRSKFPDVIE